MNPDLQKRLDSALQDRLAKGVFRRLQVRERGVGVLDLSDNDYLGLAGDDRMRAAGIEALERFGCSSSSSPLISGFGPAHAELMDTLLEWYGVAHGLVWNSGYAANQSMLRLLPGKGDLVLADRLAHNSLLSGAINSGARLIRYRHCDYDRLEALLKRHSRDGRSVFVATESVFSMDGDCSDLKTVAELRSRYGFYWILDEAHAVGWFGREGQGLSAESEIGPQIDLIVGTMGKALGSLGAYTLFNDETVARYAVNYAKEFIYSTYLPPVCAAVASEGIRIVRESRELRNRGRELSRDLRRRLRKIGYDVDDGESSVISIPIGDVRETMRRADALESRGIRVGAIRPPTVPEGSSRLRVSLKAGLSEASVDALLSALEAGL